MQRQYMARRRAKSSSSISRTERRFAIHSGLKGLSYDRKTVFIENLGADDQADEKYIVKNNRCFYEKTELFQIGKIQDPDLAFESRFDGIIYPGALLKGNSGIVEGNPQSIMVERGTVTVYADFCTGERMSIPDVPATEAAIKHATDTLVARFWKAHKEHGIDITASIAAKEQAFTSLSEMAVKLNVDANFLGAEAKVDFNTSSSSKKIISVTDYSQHFYTIFVETHFSNLANYFGESVTWDMLQREGINNRNPPVLVKSVSYGRRLYLFKEYDLTKQNTSSSQGTKFLGNSIKSAVEVSQTTEATNCWLYVSGGGASIGNKIYGSLPENHASRYISNFPTFTPENPGAPMDYQLVFLTDNTRIRIQRQGTYTKTSYAEYPNSVKIRVKSDCWGTGPTLNHLKVRFDFSTFRIANGKIYDIRRKQMAPEWKLEQKTNKSGYLDLEPDEFVHGPVRVQVRRKWCGRWANADVQNVSAETGYIGVNVKGYFKNMTASYETEP